MYQENWIKPKTPNKRNRNKELRSEILKQNFSYIRLKITEITPKIQTILKVKEEVKKYSKGLVKSRR